MMLRRKVAYWLCSTTVVAVLLISPNFGFCQVRSEEPVQKVSKQCEDKAKDETRWMTRNLYLSTEQYDKVKDLSLYYTCLMDGLNRLTDKVAINKKKGEIIKNKEAEFKAVLSQEQFEQYKNRREKKVVEKKSPFSGNI